MNCNREPECSCVDCAMDLEATLAEIDVMVFCVRHDEPECIECADAEHYDC